MSFSIEGVVNTSLPSNSAFLVPHGSMPHSAKIDTHSAYCLLCILMLKGVERLIFSGKPCGKILQNICQLKIKAAICKSIDLLRLERDCGGWCSFMLTLGITKDATFMVVDLIEAYTDCQLLSFILESGFPFGVVVTSSVIHRRHHFPRAK